MAVGRSGGAWLSPSCVGAVTNPSAAAGEGAGRRTAPIVFLEILTGVISI